MSSQISSKAFGKTTPTLSTPSREQPASPSSKPVNVGDTERWVTGAVGGLLALAGLRRSIPGLLLTGIGGALLYRAYTGHCEGYAAMGINNADESRGQGQPARPEDYFENSIHVEVCYEIEKSPEELYRFWRNFSNLPKFMHHLQSVTCQGDRSHWVAKGPAGYRVEWDAQIINDEPNRLIAWRSLGNADVDNAGSVRFVPSDRGTQVKVVIDYIPPAGKVGDAIAKLFGEDPKSQIREELARFKDLMESGESATAQAINRSD